MHWTVCVEWRENETHGCSTRRTKEMFVIVGSKSDSWRFCESSNPFLISVQSISLSEVYISSKLEAKMQSHCIIKYFWIYHESYCHHKIRQTGISHVLLRSWSPIRNVSTFYFFTFFHILYLKVIWTT